jgi:hypothetical protein
MTKNTNLPFGVKFITTTLLGITMLFNLGLRAQSIHFNYTDGTNIFYNLEDVRKITFDADLMNLHLLDGTVYAWNISTIGYYQYDESSLNVQELLNNVNTWEVVVFPNPTSSNLNIRFNLPKEDEITIALFDMQGKLILMKNIGKQVSGEQQQTLDVSNLFEGSYMCLIEGRHLRVTKKVIIN